MCIKNVENNVYVVNLYCHMPGVELVRMYRISYKKSPYMFNNCCLTTYLAKELIFFSEFIKETIKNMLRTFLINQFIRNKANYD